VSTGYSRAVAGEKPKEFHGFDGDVESVGDFIRLWITRFGRWSSPKFLIGESYGTTRAAALAGYLQERHALYLNGLMLVSSVLDFATLRFEPGNDLPPLLYAPTYAATAHFHGALAPDLQAVAGRPPRRGRGLDPRDLRAGAPARRRAAGGPGRRGGRPARALHRPRRRVRPPLPPPDRHPPLLQGAPPESRAHRGPDRRPVHRRRPRRRRRDARVRPSMGATTGAYGATINDYVRRELGFESDLPYEVIQGLYATWDYGKFQNKYVNVAETLRKAIAVHPFLRVFIASGAYDLATPHFATRYTVDHLGLPAHLRANVEERRYPGGHMMYVDVAVLEEMKRDLATFVRTASAPGRPAPT
jgi:carboxypeptidase C (cathepsin A)